mgnify:CR=1 FL=1
MQIRSRCLKKVYSHQSHFDTAKMFAFCQACLYFVKSWQMAVFQTEKEIDKKQKERSVGHEEGRLKEPRKLNERYMQKSRHLGRLDFSWRFIFFPNHCNFQYNISCLCFDSTENDNNLERNEDRTTVFLKWTNFKNKTLSFLKLTFHLDSLKRKTTLACTDQAAGCALLHTTLLHMWTKFSCTQTVHICTT